MKREDKKGEKKMKKIKKYICYYRNSNYDLKVKEFETLDEGLAFTKVLDTRIEKGTCFGYEFTSI